MNTIISGITGGYPISIDQIEYMQQNVQNMTSTIAKTFAKDGNPYILWGADFTITSAGTATPYVNYTAGALWYSDEVYNIDAVTNQALPAGMYLTGLTTMEWDVDSGTTNAVTFKDGDSHNIHKYRKAKLVNPGTSSWGISDVDRYVDPRNWTTETTLWSGWTGTLSYRFLNDFQVEVYYDLDGQSSTSSYVFNFSTAYRPTKAIYNVPVVTTTTNIAARFIVNTSGNIECTAYDKTSGNASRAGEFRGTFIYSID